MALFPGCASVGSQQTFPVKTTSSSVIELNNNLSAGDRTIYFAWQNNTLINSSLEKKFVQAIKLNGYQFVKDQNMAHYLLQIAQLQIGSATEAQLQSILSSNYGSAIPTLQPVVMSPAVSGVANTVDVSGLTPVIILDVQVSEKVVKGASISWNRYQSRIISQSLQPNVMYSQVQDSMNQDVVNVIKKMFEGK